MLLDIRKPHASAPSAIITYKSYRRQMCYTLESSQLKLIEVPLAIRTVPQKSMASIDRR